MDLKVFDSLLEPVFVFKQDLVVTYCNESAALIADQSLRKILRGSLSFLDLVKFTEPLLALKDLELLSDASPYQEVPFSTPSGKAGRTQITIQPLLIDGERKFLCFFRDVTLEETLQKKYRGELQQKEDVILELQKAKEQLENYSKNLEKMVEERTFEIQKLNLLMKGLLDSLAQGFLVFDLMGQVLPVTSKSCRKLLETDPAGQPIWDVLKIAPQKTEGFKKWLLTVKGEMLPFEDLAPLAPPTLPHSEGLEISLQYFPLRNTEQKLTGIVLVASDITELLRAQRQSQSDREKVEMILKILEHKTRMGRFFAESSELIESLQSPDLSSRTSEILRALHTLKGGFSTFGFSALASSIHEIESHFQAWPADQALSAFRKVKSDFESTQAELTGLLGAHWKNQDSLEISRATVEGFMKTLDQQAPALVEFYQETFLSRPLPDFFAAFEETVQNLAAQENKSLLPFKYEGEPVKLLTEIYSPLMSSCVHAFRNALDHGIETREERVAVGKLPEGEIRIHAQVVKNWLILEIKDNGRGIHPQKIREKLDKQGFPHEQESDEQVIQHVFDSQFSTKELVTELSGRGVGMDAIRAEAQALGGEASVQSVIGSGTKLTLRVPYFRSLSRKSKNLQSA
ncbi:MAG: ATP-binding protein [Pseudobdellovibrionaceae bacterium]